MKDAIRINKYLADQKLCTRKEADELIKRGLVFINDKPAVLGAKVKESDKVTLSPKYKRQTFDYFAYHKPEGIATSKSNSDEKDIKDSIDLPRGVFPVGRLDKESSGLIILTNDGRVTDALLNPAKKHEKEYVVTCNRTVPAFAVEKMNKGMKVEKIKVRPAKTAKTGDKEFTIILTEGKKHQIRRMAVACGLEVIKLVRTRVMNIKLGNLRKGEYRKIEGEELQEFLNELNLV